MDFTITEEFDGLTVKEFIKKKIHISSKQLTRLKRIDDGICINNMRVTVRAVLNFGDILHLGTETETKTSGDITPVDIPLDILFEDEYYIAINKPPYVPTHPSHNHHTDTLANALSYRYKKSNTPFVFRAVNRLDKNTSGIVLFAKSALAANLFSQLQQNKLVKKEYLALVHGSTQCKGKVDGYIRRREKSIIYRELCTNKISDDAQYSLTEYEALAHGDACSMVKLLLHTGRTHQIRVHMSSIGHYVIGDDLYGSLDGEQRQMLHACSMEFIHPITDKQISIQAPLPTDFVCALRKRGIQNEQ